VTALSRRGRPLARREPHRARPTRWR